jgi:hypothetical protein
LVSELKHDIYHINGNTFELSHALPMETIEDITLKFIVNLGDIAQVLIKTDQNDIANSNGIKQSH